MLPSPALRRCHSSSGISSANRRAATCAEPPAGVSKSPSAAHCSSPPAHNTGPVPPATAAVVGHCRTPYPHDYARQRALNKPPPRGRSSLGPVECFGAISATVLSGTPELPAAAPSPPLHSWGQGRARTVRDTGTRRDGCHRPGILRSDSSPPVPAVPNCTARFTARAPTFGLALRNPVCTGPLDQHPSGIAQMLGSRTLAGQSAEPGRRVPVSTPPATCCTPSGVAVPSVGIQGQTAIHSCAPPTPAIPTADTSRTQLTRLDCG